MFMRISTLGLALAFATTAAHACDKDKKARQASGTAHVACDKKAKARVIEIKNINEDQAFFGIHLGAAEDGVEIIEVIEDGPADNAGFRGGDIVVRFGDHDVEGVEGFVKLVQDREPGDDVLVEYERDGKIKTRTITLGSRGDSNLKAYSIALGSPGPHIVGLPEEIREKIGALDGKNINISIECEDGEGVVTLDRDGDKQTFEFDCEGHEGAHAFSFNGDDFEVAIPHIAHLDHEHMQKLHAEMAERFKDMDIEWHGSEDGSRNMFRNRRFLQRTAEPTVRFREDSKGRIEVVIRKGDSELVREFEDADDLEDRDPGLFEKYQALNE